MPCSFKNIVAEISALQADGDNDLVIRARITGSNFLVIGVYTDFFPIFGQFTRAFELDHTPHAPCARLYLVPELIWCWLVLAIRRCDRFGAAGPRWPRALR